MFKYITQDNNNMLKLYALLAFHMNSRKNTLDDKL